MAVFGWRPSPHQSDCGAAALADWRGGKSCKIARTFGVALAFKVTRAFKLALLKGGEINPDTSVT